ncbi:nitroreductase family protein [Kamptonema formosum]|uniref:nitroreductase family protein n=1 Tax=Kamptonema formosum TaxID=331992 RepID=UPI000344C345|nr:nitroreductase family protein [Oscillatoria sp. PCC 10802]
MLPTKVAGKHYHQVTKHSYLSVKIDPNYVESSTQPSPLKFYPKFYRRFPLEDDSPVHSFIRLTSAITFEKVYKSGPYKLRVNPSAGGLYPTEIYVQVRGVEGMIDGIYHLEVANNCLTLIYELIDDGLESYIFSNRTVKGFIFLVSCVYYRSSWKYNNRSLRYCFLDSGHHLGAIEASAYLHEREIQFLFDFDKLALNEDLGFENKEFVTACAISGELQEKTVRKLRLKVPFVCGTDYFEQNKFVEEGYRETLLPASFAQKLEQPQFNFERERFSQTIWTRRSARRFYKQPVSKENFLAVLRAAEQPVPAESFEGVEIYLAINRVEGMERGLYKGDRLLKAGDLSEKVGYLCVHQLIARDSAVTLFFVSAYRNYQTALQFAGIRGQRVYLASHYLGINCSGMGAYYDDETRAFLGTEKDVIFAMAIGI